MNWKQFEALICANRQTGVQPAKVEGIYDIFITCSAVETKF